MRIPTEPIGSIPRPPALIHEFMTGMGDDPKLAALYDEAVRDTIARFEATGSPVITDGEQRKYHNFWTYSVHGLPETDPEGFQIPFVAGKVVEICGSLRGLFDISAMRIPISISPGTGRHCRSSRP